MWHGHEGMGWWMVWGSIVMVLFWGAIIGLIVWAIQSVTSKTEKAPPPSGSQTALDIAAQRYARGEISREQFEQIKRDLKGTG